jgi:metal-responsive CopG/Arc/MetJ family transcriptional regulator
MSEMTKITVRLPKRLLEIAQGYSGEGRTETLRLALDAYNIHHWSRQMLALRGNLKLDIDAMREDREFDARGDITS